jgi:predicted nuclease with TOPRIM domain
MTNSPVLSGELSIEQQAQERLAKLTHKNTRLREKVQSQANRLELMAKRVEELKAKRTRKTSG